VILSAAMSIDDSLPNDVATLQSMLLAERAARRAAQSEAQYRAVLIEKLKFTIKKLRHERFGQSAERGVLLEQLELELADLEEDAGQAEAAARIAAAAASAAINVAAFERRSRRDGRYPIICRANALSIRCLRHARAAAGRPCARSART
jgi:transposase